MGARWQNALFALGGLVLVAVSAAGGYVAYRHLNPDEPTGARAETLPAGGDGGVVGVRRPDFTLPDYHGNMRSVSEWDGKLLVLNFWATWCGPCLDEIPMFVSLQARYADQGVQFVGVAIDEQERVREFAAEVGLNYPSIQHPTATLDLLRTYGNRQGGLPYTVIVGADGRIVYTRLGALSRAEAEHQIRKHLGG